MGTKPAMSRPFVVGAGSNGPGRKPANRLDAARPDQWLRDLTVYDNWAVAQVDPKLLARRTAAEVWELAREIVNSPIGDIRQLGRAFPDA